ncbi:hypothetical protein [Pseudokineococcus sp. 1T1Z-3]|uniref:hypothetical protein n=1 Tax=Pseudokineococcus sp. 1T1Z-3 TaxID=3132745 RepID=UPI0030ABEFDD
MPHDPGPAPTPRGASAPEVTGARRPSRASARVADGPLPPPSGGEPGPTPGRPLGDDDLADEIELYGAVVAAASATDGQMSTAEIDDALGVPRAPGAAAAAEET